MHQISKTNNMASWLFQIIAAIILANASIGKFTNAPLAVYIFETLEMGEFGRFFIGGIEGLAVILLLTSSFAQLGALLGFAVMMGALIAHSAVLGTNVQGDNGQLVIMMCTVIISTCIVMFIHRKKLPLIGHTC